MIFDEKLLQEIQDGIDDESEEESPDLTEELQWTIQRGNTRRPIRPRKADNTKLCIVRAQRQWDAYTQAIKEDDWRANIKSLSYNTRGVVEGYIRYLLRRPGSRITAESSVRVYVRHTWQVFKKYTGQDVDTELKEHTLEFIRAEITDLFALRREPKHKDQLGPDGHLFLCHFRWVRDVTTFRIGLDRIDDVCIRHLLMFAGARRHEFVYGLPKKRAISDDEYHDPEDAYSDVDIAADPYMKPRQKKCWVCGAADERTEPMRKVLCWEDVELWIVSDPERKGGRDKLAMQVLLRFHKGMDKRIQPTWYTFIEENLPVLCPITLIIIKALAEGVIEHPDYQCAENLFGTKIPKEMVHIRWKREFMHVPVFRKTLLAGEGFIKVSEPITDDVFDYNSKKLGYEVGMNLPSYVYRRGNLQVMDENYRETIRNQSARHMNGSIYTRYYQNARMRAVFQDAFLGRGTESPYIAIFNYMMRFDENVPKKLPPEALATLKPGKRLRRLNQELTCLRYELQREYGTIKAAPIEDRERYTKKQNAQRAAQQKQNRKALKIVVETYFVQANNKLLSKQVQGFSPSSLAARDVEYQQPERRRLAKLFGDLNENLPEESIVQRKIDTINAGVAYAWMLELGTVPSPSPKPKPSLLELPPEPSKPAPAPDNHAPGCAVSGEVSPRIVILPKKPDPPSTLNSPPPRVVQGPALRSHRKAPPPCIFCGQKFTRMTSMWTHVERHVERMGTSHVPCPDALCRAKGVVLEDAQSFKAHTFHEHKIPLRPCLIIRASSDVNEMETPKSNATSTPKIVLKTPVSTPRIVIRTSSMAGCA